MPILSIFLGIAIRMFYNDHSPPHFHAEYGEHEAIYEIETLRALRGQLPRRVHALVVEWASLHRDELRLDWERARNQIPLIPIDPLD